MRAKTKSDYIKAGEIHNLLFLDIEQDLPKRTIIKTRVQCKKCKYIWILSYDKLTSRNKKCPRCTNKERTNEDYENLAKTRNLKFIGALPKTANIKTKWKCNCCKNIINETFDYVKTRKIPCKNCNPLKSKIEQYNKLQKSKNLTFLFAEMPKNKNTFFKAQCNICNYIWKINFNRLKNLKKDCPKCANILPPTENDYLLAAKNKNITILSIINTKGNNRQKILCSCNICSHKWNTSLNKLKNSTRRCPKCGGSLPLAHDDFINLEKEKNVTFETLSKVNVPSARKKILVKCNKCNYLRLSNYDCLKKQKYGCPNCAGNAKKTITDYIILEKIKNIKFINLNKVMPQNSCSFILCKCNLCNYIWESSYSKIKAYGCPNCCSGKGERITRRIFEILFAEKFPKIRPDWLINPKTNYRLELDGYCEKLKLAFEYQGNQHFHKCSKFTCKYSALQNLQYRDKIKQELCKKNNIQLITIKQFNNFSPKHIKLRIEKIFNNYNLNIDLSFIDNLDLS